VITRDEVSFQRSRRRRHEEAEAHRAMFCFYGMVQAMRLNDPLQIARTPNVARWQATVNEPIVKSEIYRTIGGDAGTDPHKSRPPSPA
jgi:hypothetical protein